MSAKSTPHDDERELSWLLILSDKMNNSPKQISAERLGKLLFDELILDPKFHEWMVEVCGAQQRMGS